jgi:hypothetical protein
MVMGLLEKMRKNRQSAKSGVEWLLDGWDFGLSGWFVGLNLKYLLLGSHWPLSRGGRFLHSEGDFASLRPLLRSKTGYYYYFPFSTGIGGAKQSQWSGETCQPYLPQWVYGPNSHTSRYN